MSRGPGKWQREILAVLEKYPAFYARDLLPLEPSHAQQAALQRAICSLHEARKIAIARWWGRHPSGSRIVIFRYRTLAPPPSDIARLVEHQCNT